MASSLSVELAVVRGSGAAVVLCERGLPDPFADAYPGSVHDRAELLQALQVAGEQVAVVVRAASADLAVELLDESRWRSGRLFLVGTGDAAARGRLEAVPWLSWVRVRFVDLELVPPRIVEDGPGLQRLTGGLGLVEHFESGSEPQTRRAPEVPMARLLPELQSALLPPRLAARQLAEESEQRRRADRVVQDLQASVSWRATAPLRAAKRLLAPKRS
ncbi:MAG: hypothetical protein ACR2NB_00670 [Solirubrobacteraceae bacterium]